MATRRTVTLVGVCRWERVRRGRWEATVHGASWRLEHFRDSFEDGTDNGWYLLGPDGQPFFEWMGAVLAEALPAASTYAEQQSAR